MKHTKSKGETCCQYRTVIVPVRLSGRDYKRCHEACHKSAEIWNELVQFQRNHWATLKTDPTIKDLRAFMGTLPGELREMHSHTQQAIIDDCWMLSLPTGRTGARESKPKCLGERRNIGP